MSARILLPVWPHVKKYLEFHYGEQMAVSNRGTASFLLFNMLEKHKKGDPSTIKPSQKLIDNRTFIGYQVYVGDKDEASRGLFLSTDKIKRFNESIDNALREEMYRWCNHPNADDHYVDYNIQRFQVHYKITEDELPFDNLKRWYYRERKRIYTRSHTEVHYVAQLQLSY